MFLPSRKCVKKASKAYLVLDFYFRERSLAISSEPARYRPK